MDKPLIKKPDSLKHIKDSEDGRASVYNIDSNYGIKKLEATKTDDGHRLVILEGMSEIDDWGIARDKLPRTNIGDGKHIGIAVLNSKNELEAIFVGAGTTGQSRSILPSNEGRSVDGVVTISKIFSDSRTRELDGKFDLVIENITSGNETHKLIKRENVDALMNFINGRELKEESLIRSDLNSPKFEVADASRAQPVSPTSTLVAAIPREKSNYLS